MTFDSPSTPPQTSQTTACATFPMACRSSHDHPCQLHDDGLNPDITMSDPFNTDDNDALRCRKYRRLVSHSGLAHHRAYDTLASMLSSVKLTSGSYQDAARYLLTGQLLKPSCEDRILEAPIFVAQGLAPVAWVYGVFDGHGVRTSLDPCVDFVRASIVPVLETDIRDHPDEYITLDDLAVQHSVRQRLMSIVHSIDREYLAWQHESAAHLAHRCVAGFHPESIHVVMRSSEWHLPHTRAAAAAAGHDIIKIRLRTNCLTREQKLIDDGCTMCLCIVVGGHLISLHTGDSRLVVISKREEAAVVPCADSPSSVSQHESSSPTSPLPFRVVHVSQDHNWSDADCYDRAKRAECQFELVVRNQRMLWNSMNPPNTLKCWAALGSRAITQHVEQMHHGMINGALKLNCGRAFGNLYLKSFPEEEPPLTATPTITFVQLPDTHTACCLATDGLWNFVVEDDSHGESTHVVSCSLSASLNERRLARMSESTCSELAKKLCDRAHRPANGWQVTDDISVVLLSIAPEKRG